MSPIDQDRLKTPMRSIPQLYPPHLQTKINELHMRGIYGTGIKIALIDSGVDCSHPALGAGFGEGFKIGFGRDLVGDKFDGEHPAELNDSPCTPCGVCPVLLFSSNHHQRWCVCVCV